MEVSGTTGTGALATILAAFGEDSDARNSPRSLGQGKEGSAKPTR